MTTVGLHESSQIAKYEYIFGSQRDIVIISTEQEMKKKTRYEAKAGGRVQHKQNKQEATSDDMTSNRKRKAVLSQPYFS